MKRKILIFEVPGIPVGKERPRIVSRKGKSWAYTPEDKGGLMFWTNRERAMLKAMGRCVLAYQLDGERTYASATIIAIRHAVIAAKLTKMEPDYQAMWEELKNYCFPPLVFHENFVINKMAAIEKRQGGK